MTKDNNVEMLEFEIRQISVTNKLAREYMHILLDGKRMLSLSADQHNQHVSAEQKEFMQNICTAVNNTYGRGYDPAYMDDLYNALLALVTVYSQLHTNAHTHTEIVNSKNALKKAKIPRP